MVYKKILIDHHTYIHYPKYLCLSALSNFYFLFFRFLLFGFELFNFRSDKRFQIFFYVSVFDSVFQSRIFSAINNNFFSNFSVSEFRAFQFLFINQMPVLLFCLFLAVLYFVNFASRDCTVRNNQMFFIQILAFTKYYTVTPCLRHSSFIFSKSLFKYGLFDGSENSCLAISYKHS